MVSEENVYFPLPMPLACPILNSTFLNLQWGKTLSFTLVIFHNFVWKLIYTGCPTKNDSWWIVMNVFELNFSIILLPKSFLLFALASNNLTNYGDIILTIHKLSCFMGYPVCRKYYCLFSKGHRKWTFSLEFFNRALDKNI